MKKMSYRRMFAILVLFATLGTLTTASAQITPSQDSYTNTATATTNYGNAATLGVVSSAGSIQTTYLQFNLTSIPAGYTSANIAKATLKLYVNSVTTAGSFNVDYVNGNWSEKTITSGLSPALGNTIYSGMPLTTANANNYLQLDVTSAVGAWLNGSEPNDGIALVANSPLSATFDSKENGNQSHPAELDIVFTSGGSITGVNTAGGSGLSGGGTSGLLNLSLLKTCANKQILQWNGSAWGCSAAGTGTVSSVGLSAPASDFTISGSPVAGTGTLNLAWKVVPTSANVANAIVKRDAGGNVAAQGIFASGEINSSGLVSLATSSNAAVVFAQNSATTGASTYGVYGESDSEEFGGAGVFGFAPLNSVASGVYGRSDTAYTSGVLGVNSNDSATKGLGGIGVEGIGMGAHGTGVYGVGVSGSQTGATTNFFYSGAAMWGDTSAAHATTEGQFAAVMGTADDNYAGYFENNSPNENPALFAVTDDPFNLPFIASNSATGQYCYVDASGDLNCTGSKNAVVPIDGGQRTVALSAIESPKNWFEDLGSAQLTAGAAVITLEPDFVQTVNTGMEYHVFLTPNGDCKGLYVSRKSASSFEVRELGSGASSVSFDYRIVALRKNFENIRLRDHTKDIDPAKLFKTRVKAKGAPAKADISKIVPHPRPVPSTQPIAQKTIK